MNEKLYDLLRAFEYENGFYATASTARFSKFVTHLDLFRQTSNLRGEIVECGVFKGNSFFRWIKFRDLLENTFSRRIVGFDAFGAFPETTYVKDMKKRDAFIRETSGGIGITEEEMGELLSAQALDKNVELVKGDINETVPDYVAAHDELRISLLHIDVDIFEPTKTSLEHLFDRVVKGGVVIFDDYGAFPGANDAIEGWLGDRYSVLKMPYSNAIGYVVK
jgi:hypothetical protein